MSLLFELCHDASHELYSELLPVFYRKKQACKLSVFSDSTFSNGGGHSSLTPLLDFVGVDICGTRVSRLHMSYSSIGFCVQVLRGGSLQLLLQLPRNARYSCAAFAAFFAAFAASHKYQNISGCLGACTSLAQAPHQLKDLRIGQKEW